MELEVSEVARRIHLMRLIMQSQGSLPLNSCISTCIQHNEILGVGKLHLPLIMQLVHLTNLYIRNLNAKKLFANGSVSSFRASQAHTA